MMPEFRFQSITNSGEIKNGFLQGRDQADVVKQLSSRGETATEVDLVKPSMKIAHFTSTRKRKMSRVEMATMIRELATAQEAGLPLMQALRTIRKQASPATGDVLDG